MALAFLRTTPLILAEWSEIDFKGKRWKVPKEHMKGHTSPHIVLLARQTIQILELVGAISGKSKYLFPGQGPKNPAMSNGTILKALERMISGDRIGHTSLPLAFLDSSQSRYAPPRVIPFTG